MYSLLSLISFSLVQADGGEGGRKLSMTRKITRRKVKSDVDMSEQVSISLHHQLDSFSAF